MGMEWGGSFLASIRRVFPGVSTDWIGGVVDAVRDHLMPNLGQWGHYKHLPHVLQGRSNVTLCNYSSSFESIFVPSEVLMVSKETILAC